MTNPPLNPHRKWNVVDKTGVIRGSVRVDFVTPKKDPAKTKEQQQAEAEAKALEQAHASAKKQGHTDYTLVDVSKKNDLITRTLERLSQGLADHAKDF